MKPYSCLQGFTEGSHAAAEVCAEVCAAWKPAGAVGSCWAHNQQHVAGFRGSAAAWGLACKQEWRQEDVGEQLLLLCWAVPTHIAVACWLPCKGQGQDNVGAGDGA